MNGTPSPLSPADNPAVTTHINLLQGIINRLANNSSSCKTWCLTMVGALLSLAGATHTPAIVTFALVPVVIFAFVDTMYLAQEKAYRDLYGMVVKAIRDGSYSRAQAFNATAERTLYHVGWALTSWAVWPIYGGLIAAYVVAEWRGWLALLAATAKT
jgi:ABC-type multidrug transport system permease subunit